MNQLTFPNRDAPATAERADVAAPNFEAEDEGLIEADHVQEL